MKLYDAPWAPSPRRVRIFLAEKGLEVPCEAIDLRTGEHLGDAYLRINPRGAVPALELDDGEVLCESAAICRYFEALNPEPPLFGTAPLEIGRIESWTRRIEGDGYAAAVYVLRNTVPAFKDRAIPGAGLAAVQIPELAARGTLMWEAFTEALDARLADREWIAGGAYSFADITALVTIDFARAAKLVVPGELTHLRRWHEAASARPSASA
ncbi:glutathione S-transferase N-terminal domain-containing protein [Sphingomonas sp. BT-65]|uniref:glutathione S-transferase family protein n=1 Tax=Sphingomonas sp. BT-65 TaxID=2989821 RepID=UPI0022364553|nr:glutathione S-transferase N-terminal domain-containing protein [Sphingomonas sp. BT-65]MCW4463315.1 glutathione S-transferase N-terminal domain-containing protein [Sphingomonas sp. BT-65]